MHDLARVYEPWAGNAAAMADAIGEKPVTVRQWRNRGKIDQDYWPKIITKARELGFELLPTDFVPGIVAAIDHAASDTTDLDATSSGNAGEVSTPAAQVAA